MVGHLGDAERIARCESFPQVETIFRLAPRQQRRCETSGLTLASGQQRFDHRGRKDDGAVGSLARSAKQGDGMASDRTHNGSLFAGTAIGCALLMGLGVALLGSKAGEIAQALASIVGGMIGFGGVAWTLTHQSAEARKSERRDVLQARRRLAVAYAAELRNAYRMDPEQLTNFMQNVAADIERLSETLADPMYSPSRTFDATVAKIGLFDPASIAEITATYGDIAAAGMALRQTREIARAGNFEMARSVIAFQATLVQERRKRALATADILEGIAAADAAELDGS
jgi:hypothetical protein